MTIGAVGEPARRNDLVDDLKSLFAFAVPAGFFDLGSAGTIFRIVALGSLAYGAYVLARGFWLGLAFYQFDAGVFFILGALPLLIAGRLAEEGRP
jgi:hypothetical protein